MKISKRNLKKRAEKEVERKLKRKEKHKIKMQKIEFKNAFKKIFSFLGQVEVAKQIDIQAGNNPTILKVPDSLFKALLQLKSNDGKVQGLELQSWDQEKDKEMILEKSLDIKEDFMVL